MSDTFDQAVEGTKEVFGEEVKTRLRASIHDVIEAKKAEILTPTTVEEGDEGEEDEEDDTLEEGAGRLVATKTNGNKEAKVYYSSADQEYTVKLMVGGKHEKEADYFTDDKDDATGTAAQMVK